MAKVKAHLRFFLSSSSLMSFISTPVRYSMGIPTSPFVTSAGGRGLPRSGLLEAIFRGIPRVYTAGVYTLKPAAPHDTGQMARTVKVAVIPGHIRSHEGPPRDVSVSLAPLAYARPPAHAIRPHALFDRRQPRRQNWPPTLAAKPTPPHKQAGAENSTLRDATAGATEGTAEDRMSYSLFFSVSGLQKWTPTDGAPFTQKPFIRKIDKMR